MRDEMTESDLLSLLCSGVKRSSDLIAQITDYHGGPVTTEYILTSDIARVLTAGPGNLHRTISGISA
jgi:hypothetical protein